MRVSVVALKINLLLDSKSGFLKTLETEIVFLTKPKQRREQSLFWLK
jgi:hypothetical protein